MNTQRHSQSIRRTPGVAPFGLAHRNIWSNQMEAAHAQAYQGPASHPLADYALNQRLAQYEEAVRSRFNKIVPVLRHLASLQHEPDFEARAQKIAVEEFGFPLPAATLDKAWVTTLDMRQLYTHTLLETFRLLANHENAFIAETANEAEATKQLLTECGFHAADVSACADGRLKGLLRYILRLSPQAIHRNQSYAGALFDVEGSVHEWIKIELNRHREGIVACGLDPTQYLKIAVYHRSSSAPTHEGCAAHASDCKRAAQAALDRLYAFKTAIENGFCCGASVSILMIGVDTDNDSIRIHIPNAKGQMSIGDYIDSLDLYRETLGLSAREAVAYIANRIGAAVQQMDVGADNGMLKLVEALLIKNLSQVDYVQQYHNGQYQDVGHAERFISLGDGYEEVQIRNIAYFGYMHTVEEGALDLDVGIRIFNALNISKGLPVPISVHFRYDERVPGSRERSVERCLRVRKAIHDRYPELTEQGLLWCGMSVQGKQPGSVIERIESPNASLAH